MKVGVVRRASEQSLKAMHIDGEGRVEAIEPAHHLVQFTRSVHLGPCLTRLFSHQSVGPMLTAPRRPCRFKALQIVEVLLGWRGWWWRTSRKGFVDGRRLFVEARQPSSALIERLQHKILASGVCLQLRFEQRDVPTGSSTDRDGVGSPSSPAPSCMGIHPSCPHPALQPVRHCSTRTLLRRT